MCELDYELKLIDEIADSKKFNFKVFLKAVELLAFCR